jgi:hypothetical protein
MQLLITQVPRMPPVGWVRWEWEHSTHG